MPTPTERKARKQLPKNKTKTKTILPKPSADEKKELGD